MLGSGCEAWPNPATPNQTSDSKHSTIAGAARDLLDQVVPSDKLGRTYAELTVCAMIECACNGDVRAMRLILEITEEQPKGKEPAPERQLVVRFVGDRADHSAGLEQDSD